MSRSRSPCSRSSTSSRRATRSSTSRRGSSSASSTSWPGTTCSTTGSRSTGRRAASSACSPTRAAHDRRRRGLRRQEGRPPHPERRHRPHPRRARPPGHPGQQGHQPAPQGARPEPAGRGLRDRQDQGRRPPLQGQVRARGRRPGADRPPLPRRAACRSADLARRAAARPTTTSSCAARRKSALAYYNPRLGPARAGASSRWPTASRRATPSRPSRCTRCMNPEVPLVTLSGAAGTGKTLLALAGALEQRRDVPPDLPGAADRAAVEPRHRLPAGRHPVEDQSRTCSRCGTTWGHQEPVRRARPGVQAGRRDGRDREAPHRAARLHPRPQPLERHLHRRRGAEPDAARGARRSSPAPARTPRSSSPATSSRSTRPTSTPTATASPT